MVNFCVVIGCRKRANRDKGTSFYRLPSIITHQGAQTRELSERRRWEWLAAIRRQDIKPENYPHTRVCSDHFIGGKPSTLYETTHPDWVPSRNLGHDERKEVEGGRYARAAERTAKRTANRTRMWVYCSCWYQSQQCGEWNGCTNYSHDEWTSQYGGKVGTHGARKCSFCLFRWCTYNQACCHKACSLHFSSFSWP